MVQKKTRSRNIKNSEIRTVQLPLEDFPQNADLTSDVLHALTIDNEYLRSPKGLLLCHKNRQILREMESELEFMDKLSPEELSLYSLWSTLVDFSIPLAEEPYEYEWFRELLLNDPALRTAAGPEQITQLRFLHLVESFLNRYGLRNPRFPQIPLGQQYLDLQSPTDPNEVSDFEDPFFADPFFEKDKDVTNLLVTLHKIASTLNPTQKTVFMVTLARYGSITLALMLALGVISGREFGMTLFLVQGILAKEWGGSQKMEKKAQDAVLRDINLILNFEKLFHVEPTKAEKLIAIGETLFVEFKSSMRKAIGAPAPQTVIETQILKPIVAFVNSEGGTLLVGVDDKGNVLGIDPDEFESEDKYLLHFTNLFNSRIGKDKTALVKWSLEPAHGKKVLVVECSKSSVPVFLKTNGDEDFFIRTGPASVQLNSRQLIEYIQLHFTPNTPLASNPIETNQ